MPGDRELAEPLAVAQVLLETLERLGLNWPPADYDIEEQERRLLDEPPIS